MNNLGAALYECERVLTFSEVRFLFIFDWTSG